MKNLGKILIILGFAMLVVWGTFAFVQSDLAIKVFPDLFRHMRAILHKGSRFGSKFNFQLALLGICKNLGIIALFVASVILIQYANAEKKRINKKRKPRA